MRHDLVTFTFHFYFNSTIPLEFLVFLFISIIHSGVGSKLKGGGLHLSEILTSQQRGMVMVILKLKKIWGLSPTPTPVTYMYVTCSNKSGGGGFLYGKLRSVQKKGEGRHEAPPSILCASDVYTQCVLEYFHDPHIKGAKSFFTIPQFMQRLKFKWTHDIHWHRSIWRGQMNCWTFVLKQLHIYYILGIKCFRRNLLN